MSEPLLLADNLHRAYVMGRTRLDVLRGCSLRLADGEFVAIMGKSGSGKSTLLHVLGALDTPQQGQVIFRGQPIFPAESRQLRLRRHHVGFVFQFYHLLPELNVLENVLLPRMVSTSVVRWWGGAKKAALADARAILQRVGLGERLLHRPSELSGGEQQRVAIARALVHRPAVLLADEPTGNLDAEAGRRIMELLSGLHRDGQTLVIVTHDPGVARYADRTLLLRDGQLHPTEPAPAGEARSPAPH